MLVTLLHTFYIYGPARIYRIVKNFGDKKLGELAL